MSHTNVIDRKALKQYKKMLADSFNNLITDKFEELKTLITGDKPSTLAPINSADQPANLQVKKRAASRSDILNFALIHVAIAHYEKENKLYFEHQVEFRQGDTSLVLDALRQDDDLPEDIILDVHYLRKPYLDAPVYGPWLAKKIEIYELLTGRPAKGVLIAVVGRERMLEGSYLDLTQQGIKSCDGKVTLQVYSCEQVGFHSGAVSVAMFASNLKSSTSPTG